MINKISIEPHIKKSIKSICRNWDLPYIDFEVTDEMIDLMIEDRFLELKTLIMDPIIKKYWESLEPATLAKNATVPKI